MAAGATYEPIATSTVSGSTTNTVTFSSLGSYTDIILVCSFTATSGTAYGGLRFNGDTATNYSTTILSGNGTSAASSRATSANYIKLVDYGAGTTIPALGIANIFSYGGSTNKTCLNIESNDKNGSGAVVRYVGLWRSTAAITSITVFEQGGSTYFAAGSTFTLYGIKAA